VLINLRQRPRGSAEAGTEARQRWHEAFVHTDIDAYTSNGMQKSARLFSVS
jgi:hypothetical protein